MENCKFRITPSKTVIKPELISEFGSLANLFDFPRCQLLINENQAFPFCSSALHHLSEEECPIAQCYSSAELSVEEMNRQLDEIFKMYRSS